MQNGRTIPRLAQFFVAVSSLVLLLSARVAHADGVGNFVYEGRLTNAGSPVVGPVAMRLSFYHTAAPAAPILSVTTGLENTPLAEGVFQISVDIPPADYARVFSDVTQPVWVEITDLTHAPNAPYPRQKLSMVPYAARVPVDGQNLSFNSSGVLTLGPTATPTAGQFLTKDTNGNLIWATPAASAAQIAGQTVSSTAPASGQVLQYNGSQWVPAAAATTTAAASGSISVTAPLAITGAAPSQVISATQATSVSAGYLSASDWVNFTGKLSRSGDSMSGALDMGSSVIHHLGTPTLSTDGATKGYVDTAAIAASGSTALTGNWAVGGKDITGVGNLGISSGKVLGLGTFDLTTEPALTGSLGTLDKGKTWYNVTTNQVKYWNGTAGVALGTSSGTGLLNLNGLTASTQNFATDQAGTAPMFTSSTATHTLSLPLASAGGVTAGLISNTDYTNFAGKLAGVVAGSGLSTSAAGGTVSVALASVGTAGSYVKVVTNAQGQVTGGTSLGSGDIPNLPAGILTSGTVNLAQMPNLPAAQITSGTLALGLLPTLPATILTSGTVNLAQMPNLPAAQITSGTLALSIIPSLPASTINTGTFSTAQIPNLAASYVALAGSTMNGPLALAANGLAVGTTQLVINAGNIGIGTSAPAGKLDVFGTICLNGSNCISTWPSGGTVGGGISSIAAGAGLTGGTITTTGSLSLATVGSAGSYTKVFTDAYGRVTGATTLVAGDIPPLPASALTSGTLALSTVPSLPAVTITSGTLLLSTIPSLPASTIGSGTFALATVPSLPASVLTSGTLSSSVLPSLSATYVAVAGATMAGALQLPANGLVVGTNELVVAGGNVGIGSAAPGHALDVNGTVGASAILAPGVLQLDGAASIVNGDGTDIGADINMAAGNLYGPSGTLTMSAGAVTSAYYGGSYAGPKIILQGVQYEANTNLILRAGQQIYGNGQIQMQDSSGNNKMVVLQTGNVGIGTTSPGANLHVFGSNPSIQIAGTGASAGSGEPQLLLTTTNGTGTTWSFRGGSGNSSTNLRIGTNGTGQDLVNITAAGNVGIGSTSPAATLDVNVGASATSGFGSITYSSQPASDFTSPTAPGALTGETLTIVVPAGSSRRYRLVWRDYLYNGATSSFILNITTSTASRTTSMVMETGVVDPATYVGISGETNVTLAPGTYTYYKWIAMAGSASGFDLLNGAGRNRVYCDFYAVQM